MQSQNDPLVEWLAIHKAPSAWQGSGVGTDAGTLGLGADSAELSRFVPYRPARQ